MTGIEPAHAAHHEAGHAVMADLLGHPIRSVSIVPDESSGGRMAWEGGLRAVLSPNLPRTPADVERLEGVLCVFLAGFAAAGQSGRQARLGVEDDVETALELADVLLASRAWAGTRESYVEHLYAQTYRTIHAHWDAVDRIAGELLRRRTLSAAEIRAALRDPSRVSLG